MYRSYVFLGPTLDHESARRIFDCEYRGPVECGDVCRLALLPEKPFAIGIIDGRFDSVPAVFHKEILFAITRGIHVFGASSMGALRAAELDIFGMVGVGQIYAAYKSGEITEDDDVCVSHSTSELQWRAVSHAMCNIRATITKAWEDAIITTKTRDDLIAYAKSKHYPDRSIHDVANQCPSLDKAELKSYVKSHFVDLKKEDAISLLKLMRDVEELKTPVPPHQFSLELTYPLEQLIYDARK